MRRWGRGKALGWLSARLVIVGLTPFLAGTVLAAPAGAAVATTAGTALATHPVWKIQSSPDITAPDGHLGSVSCSSADACTAVGASSNTQSLTVTMAERWNGTSWRVQGTPQPGSTIPGSSPDLSGVSCPTATFCAAVGANQVVSTQIGLADAWNGTTWKQMSFPEPPGSTSEGPDQVSCTSASFCEAVGLYLNGSRDTLPLAARWNGSSWRLQNIPGSADDTDVLLTGVSCASTTFCMAVGLSFDGGTFAERWNGTSWHAQTLPGDVGEGAVSCASAAFCEVVGSGSGADVWNGSSWSAQTIPEPAGSTSASLAGVSCVTAAFCEAVGKYNDTSGDTLSLGLTWNGTSWAVQTTPNPAGASLNSLSQVSCVSVTACETAGSSQVTSNSGQLALAESWNGSSWQLQDAVSPRGALTNNLNAVSCTSAVFCEAVGSRIGSGSATDALAETWNGSTWQVQNTPDPVQAASGLRMRLAGVSCVSAVFCEAVGASSSSAGGGAEMWNGTTWALQAIPDDSLTSVSCVSVSFCMAAGADGHADIWNGTSWSSQPTSATLMSLSGVSCASPTSCEATGADPGYNAAAEVWNGTSWSPQTVPAPAGGSSPTLSAISCTGAGSCEAVGNYTSGTTFEEVPLAEAWNGTAWAVQTTPAPASAFLSSLAGVWCTSANSCTAAGQYTPGTGPSATVAEVWNGTSWRLQNTPNRPYAGQSLFNGVSCGASTTCTAVGVTTNPGQIPATLVETGD
jgi:hypothetical protein